MTIKQLDHVNIYTDNLAGTVDFYVGVIGLYQGERPTTIGRPGAWQFPQATRHRMVRSLRKRLGCLPTETLDFFRQLTPDVYCCFGATPASADVIQASKILGARSVLFLISDKELNEECAAGPVTAKQRRRIRFREAMTAAILSGHRRVPPFGLEGGEAGALGRGKVIGLFRAQSSMV